MKNIHWVYLIITVLFLIPSPASSATGDVINTIELASKIPNCEKLYNVGFDGTYIYTICGSMIYKFNLSGNLIVTAPWSYEDVRDWAWDGNYLWICSDGNPKPDYRGAIIKLDVSNLNIIETFDWSHYHAYGIAWDGSKLWVVGNDSQGVYTVDPNTGIDTYKFQPPGSKPLGLAWDGQHLWMTDYHNDSGGTDQLDDHLYKLNPANGEVVNEYTPPSGRSRGITYNRNNGTLFYTGETAFVYEIDATEYQTCGPNLMNARCYSENDLRSGVCEIVLPNPNGPGELRLGTGFLIARNMVLTAYHIFDKKIPTLPGWTRDQIAQNSICRFGKEYESCDSVYPTSSDSVDIDSIIIEGDDTNYNFGSKDFCLLKLESSAPSKYKAYKLFQNVFEGEPITIFGFPEGMSAKQVACCNIIDLTPLYAHDDVYFEMSCHATHGMSGGPVVNSSGKVVGLVVGKDVVGEQLVLKVDSIFDDIKRYIKADVMPCIPILLLSGDSLANNVDVSGYWKTFYTTTGVPGGSSLGYFQLQQMGENITGTRMCWNPISVSGSTNDKNITFSWTENDGTDFTMTGTINGDKSNGTWIGIGPNEGSGEWRLDRVKFAGCDNTKPVVVSTNPADGAVGVSRNLETVSFTFSDEMLFEYSYYPGWAGSLGSIYWASNLKTFYTTRADSGLLPPNTTIIFTLNPPGHDHYFRDLYGNPMDEYTFSFTTGD